MVKPPLKFWRICFIVIGILLLPQLIWANGINLGSISGTPAREIKKFLPLAVYLGKELQSEGIEQGKVVVARNIAEMSEFLRKGKVDLYIDSVYPSLAASRLSGSCLRRALLLVGLFYPQDGLDAGGNKIGSQIRLFGPRRPR
jgi:hypothetical protein